MPAKPIEAGGPKFRSVAFYPADEKNMEKVRQKLQRLDPTRREVPIADVIRHALAVAAGK
jgi:hypothetical protein